MDRSGKPYRLSPARRAINTIVRPLARLGLTGPRTYLLTVAGRRTGKLWSTPVSIVRLGDERWLVAPYGVRNWVRNARAAGWVELRRGRTVERLEVSELSPAQAVPVLQEYYRRGRVTRPFFAVTLRSSNEEWLSDAPRHPVFELRSNRCPTSCS
ncbi:MAG TPA: nitroreductase/quinone reductase family protein [Gaiellaceae bacterium]|nr:nitroreductase/quinone reductase family protein [Gaiellaceae bacterium]